jgi:hypothetical protein
VAFKLPQVVGQRETTRKGSRGSAERSVKRSAWRSSAMALSESPMSCKVFALLIRTRFCASSEPLQPHGLIKEGRGIPRIVKLSDRAAGSRRAVRDRRRRRRQRRPPKTGRSAGRPKGRLHFRRALGQEAAPTARGRPPRNWCGPLEASERAAYSLARYLLAQITSAGGGEASFESA